MIEEYLNTITNVTNYVDGLLVIDSDYRIVYLSNFRAGGSPLEGSDAVGRSYFELYPHLDPASSTMVQAIEHGKVSLHRQTRMTTAEGASFLVLDSTYPVVEDGRIIGAVSVAFFPEKAEGAALQVCRKDPAGPKKLFTVADLIGRSPQIQAVRSQVEKVCRTSSSVMIYGQTGTGKELVAQSIHSGSDRAGGPFFSQNCAAIPENLLESLFFGTKKGAYTGAEDRAGIFERAVGGTVFLDEINSMDPGLQAKLLRALEERRAVRVGGEKEYEIDVRLIAASGRDPSVCVREGSLRADLFFRLSGVTIYLPPLREREGDLDFLTRYFISFFNQRMHRDLIGVSQDVMRIFQAYDWPGNVRELRNAIEGAFNLCEGKVIVVSDLPYYITEEVGSAVKLIGSDRFEDRIQWLGSLKTTMDAYEKTLLLDAVNRSDSYSAAAEYLGITRQSLHQKMKRLDIRRDTK